MESSYTTHEREAVMARIEDLLAEPTMSDLFDVARKRFQCTKELQVQFAAIQESALNYLPMFLESLTQDGIPPDRARELLQPLKNFAVEVPVKDPSEEFLSIYKKLDVVQDATRRAVYLSVPSKAANAVMVGAAALGDYSAGDPVLGALAAPLKKAATAAGLGAKDASKLLAQSAVLASEWCRLDSEPVFSSADVYFSGPWFYKRGGLSLTLAETSGLPNPVEWRGSEWFARTFQIEPKELSDAALDKLSPSRSVNFDFGLCYGWPNSRRIYVWNRLKTGAALRKCIDLAKSHGRHRSFLAECVDQLNLVFLTRNLMILQVDQFTNDLKLCTRTAQDRIMFSGRLAGGGKIYSGLWVQRDVQLSPSVLTAVDKLAEFGAMAAAIAAAATVTGQAKDVPFWVPLVSVFATGGLAYLVDRHKRDAFSRHIESMIKAMTIVESKLRVLWNAADRRETVPGLVKAPSSYFGDAREAAVATLAHLIGTTTDEVLATASR
jgi:hypothetical protein